MIISLLGALALQASFEPVSIDCRLVWTSRAQRWSPALECPSDAPDAEALQAAANAILEPNSLRIESFFEPSDLRVEFISGPQGWDLAETTSIYRAPPRYPASQASRGIAALCHGVVHLNRNGQPDSDEWVCRTNHHSNTNRGSRFFALAASRATDASYWIVPQSGGSLCLRSEHEFNLHDPDGTQSHAPEFPASEGPQCPDSD